MKPFLNFPIDDEELQKVEYRLRIDRSIQRYLLIRRFCYGHVLDFGSGSGFGTKLIQQSPDVTSVRSYDIENGTEQAIWTDTFDTIVLMEVLEHLERPQSVIEQLQGYNILVSFPDKKTTHFNPYHKHDLTTSSVVNLFLEHVLYHKMQFFDSTVLCLIKKPSSMPHHIVRNLHEL